MQVFPRGQVLLLNKCDLVPTWVTARWIKVRRVWLMYVLYWCNIVTIYHTMLWKGDDDHDFRLEDGTGDSAQARLRTVRDGGRADGSADGAVPAKTATLRSGPPPRLQ